MARILSTWIDGFIGSAKQTGNWILNAFGKKVPEMAEHFASDFGGYGWKIYPTSDGKYVLEIDSVKIRESLVAHELIIDQIRAIAGALGISQACGKVKKVSENSVYYFLNLEGDETHGYGGFQQYDFIRCQRWTGSGLKGYWVRIEEIVNNGDGDWLVIPKDQFNGTLTAETEGVGEHVDTETGTMNTPAAGDEIVQYGNAKDTSRQSAIYIHANGEGQPAIDMLTGIKSKSFDGCLAARLGGDLPNTDGAFGLYSKNGKVFSQSGDTKHYELNPDGTFSLGNGAITYNGKGNVTIGNNVTIGWDSNKDFKVEYAISSQGTTAPTSGWSSTMPTDLKQGTYLWTRTTYPSGNVAYDVNYIGKDGSSLSVTKVEYTISDDGSKQPTSGWSTTYPTNVQKGNFIWTRTTYSDGTKVYSSSYIGKDGESIKGEDGQWTSYVFKQSESLPSKPSGTDPIPNDWSDAPTSSGRWWMSKATIIGGKAQTWSDPIQVTAKDGNKGADGNHTEFRYAVNTSLTSSPSLSVNTRTPSGWSTTPPSVGTGQYLWLTQAVIDANDALVEKWSKPVRISGEKGDKGEKGDQGAQGIPGTSAVDPAVYSLIADVGSIRRTQANGGTPSFTPSTINVKAYVTTGLSTKEYTSGIIAWTVYKNDGTSGKTGTGGTLTAHTDYTSSTIRIDFTLTVNATIVARLSIPVVWDGKDGKDGADGTNQHNNLLEHTDFTPPSSAYGGTLLNFRADAATIATGATISTNTFIGGGDVLKGTAGSSGTLDLFKYNVKGMLSPSTWYVLALTLRGSGTATAYCYPNGHDTAQTLYADNEADGANDDAHCSFTLTSGWQRHFIAFKTPSNLSTSDSKYVLIRLSAGSSAEVAQVNLATPYGGQANTAERAQTYIQHGAALMRQAFPSNAATFGGINSLIGRRSSLIDVDFFSQNITNSLIKGEWYTLSFYLYGAAGDTLETYIYESGVQVISTTDAPLADGVAETSPRSDGKHSWSVTSGWTRHTYTFRVISSGSFSKAILLFRLPQGTKGANAAICQVKLEQGKKATDWCLNQMDREAVTLPEWMQAFNGCTLLGNNYVASGNAFFGRKNTDGTYDGCFLSSDALSVGGNEVLGFYALKGDKVVVAIDPIAQKYSFKGEVTATSGTFENGTFSNIQSKNGTFKLSSEGNTSIELDNNGLATFKLENGSHPFSITRSGAEVMFIHYDDSTNQSVLMQIASTDNSRTLTLFSDGINIYKEGGGINVLTSMSHKIEKGDNRYYTTFTNVNNTTRLMHLLKGLPQIGTGLTWKNVYDLLQEGQVFLGETEYKDVAGSKSQVAVAPLYIKISNA